MVSQRQQRDLECIKFFVPGWVVWQPITAVDEKMFLENSERGWHKERIHHTFYEPENRDGFNALIQGKRWRGIHIHELWKQGLAEGTLLLTDLKELPPVVWEYVKKELKLP